MLVRDGPCAASCRWIICILNLILFVSSLLFFLVGISVQYFREWFVDLLRSAFQLRFFSTDENLPLKPAAQNLPFVPSFAEDLVTILNDVYIAPSLIALGVTFFIVSVVGFLGIQRQSRGILSWYITLLFLLSTLSAALCVVFYLRIESVQDRVEVYLYESLGDPSKNNDEKRYLNEQIHKKYRCCGYKNGYLDYIRSPGSKDLPDYCCNVEQAGDTDSAICSIDSFTHKTQIYQKCSKKFWVHVNRFYCLIMYVFGAIAVFSFLLGLMSGIAPIIKTII
ncbi:Tetraspanin [Cichlidogyrus casuarinus]|uniref:Tetraspanin n=1 Tax=Cichlidogyrus casuarinus TaxID=1844966 RepID=A0ABD2PJP7_9PLAT